MRGGERRKIMKKNRKKRSSISTDEKNSAEDRPENLFEHRGNARAGSVQEKKKKKKKKKRTHIW
jgi:hypothetical protein